MQGRRVPGVAKTSECRRSRAFKLRVRSWILLFSGTCALTAFHAQGQEVPSYAESIKVGSTVAPLDQNAFGERLDKYKGDLSFHQTDLVLKGTGPDIVIGRTYELGRYRKGDGPLGFADWSPSIPHMLTRGSAEKPWRVVQQDALKRCTFFSASGPVIPIPVREWWEGYELVDELGRTQMPMRRDPNNPVAPSNNPAGYPVVTQAGWQASCLPQTSNGQEGEGFSFLSPAGNRYRLDRLLVSRRSQVHILERDPAPPVRARVSTLAMVASRIEDRFGNFVDYNFDGDRLISISGSDGRLVTFEWNDDVITAMNANGRVWTYSYAIEGTSAISKFKSLKSVTQPDGSRYTFDLGAFYSLVAPPPPTECAPPDTSAISRPVQASMAGPSGLSATYLLNVARRGRSNVPYECVPGNAMSEEHVVTPSAYDVYALSSRTYTGPGVNQTWQYAYGAPNPSWTHQCAGGCIRTVQTTETLPGGRWVRSTFSNEWGAYEGKLVAVEDGGTGATLPTRTTRYHYAPSSGNAYPAVLGAVPASSPWASNFAPLSSLTPVHQVDIELDGDWYRSTFGGYNAFAQPSSRSDLDSTGGGRTLDFAPVNNVQHWVLDLPGTTSLAGNAVASEQVTYDDKARPISVSIFGRIDRTAEYWPDGNLRSVVDGRGNATLLSEWYRGTPRQTVFADGTSQRVDVDANGWITSVVDEANNKTCYAFDRMGRISGITFPAATAGVCDGSISNPVAVAFGPVGSAEHGLAAGHWRRTETRGNAVNEQFFDALWQPVLSTRRDNGRADAVAWIRRSYDEAGRTTFESYPTRTPEGATSGVWTEYDAVGRVSSTSQDSEVGLLTTVTTYQAGNSALTRLPEGQVTAYRFDGYGAPVKELPAVIDRPESARTSIQRDAWGKPLSIERSKR